MTLTDKLLIAVLVLSIVLVFQNAYATLLRRRLSARREPMTPDGKYDATPAVVANITTVTWVMLIGLTAALLLGMLAKMLKPDMPDWVPMILPALTLIGGQIMGERKQVAGYLFDGTPSTNETNATNAKIAAHLPLPPTPDAEPLKVDLVGTPGNPPEESKP